MDRNFTRAFLVEFGSRMKRICAHTLAMALYVVLGVVVVAIGLTIALAPVWVYGVTVGYPLTGWLGVGMVILSVVWAVVLYVIVREADKAYWTVKVEDTSEK